MLLLGDDPDQKRGSIYKCLTLTFKSVRHIGVSNFPPSMVEEAERHATIFCNQVEYHPYKARDELLRQARKMDYLLTAWRPISKGAVLKDRTLAEIGEAHGKTRHRWRCVG